MTNTNKTIVQYQAGQSRYGNHAIDYMLAIVGDTELYAEAENYTLDETSTYNALKDEIIFQARKHNINIDQLVFES